MSVKITVEEYTGTCSSEVKRPIIPGSFKTIIRFLNYCGTCPLSYNKNSPEKYYFQWFSYTTIICFVATSILILGFGSLYVFMLNGDLPITRFTENFTEITDGYIGDKTPKEPAATIVYYLEILFVLLLPASRIQGIIYGWWNKRSHASFLNSWRKFHLEFDERFYLFLQQDQTLSKTEKPHYCKIWAIFIFPGVVYTFVPAATNDLGSSVIYYMLFNLVLATILYGSEYLEDLETICMFRMIVNAFNLMQQGIEFTVLRQTCHAETAMKWREMVISIRNQCGNMSKFLSTREMLLVFHCIFLSTSCLFCIVHFPLKKGYFKSLLVFWVYLCSSTFLRIYVKALQAGKITAAEKDLTTTIALIKRKHTDLAMLHEIKFLHDLMTADPTRVKFGNYLTYNQKVVLTILGQIVTYWIVLMQFALV